jgi:hypothetical protein
MEYCVAGFVGCNVVDILDSGRFKLRLVLVASILFRAICFHVCPMD